jgi:cytochrome c peroxidase
VKTLIPLILLLAAGLGYATYQFWAPPPGSWTAAEAALIRSMSLSALPPLPADPSNRVADDPLAAELGHQLFFDERLSSTGTVSCATCHQPEHYFTDQLPLAVGKSLGPRHTPGLVGLSHSPWFYWDGRKDSQWAQALAPLEAAHEHDFSRSELASLISSDAGLTAQYEKIFGALPEVPMNSAPATPDGDADKNAAWQALDAEQQQAINQIYANAGKALAAYQRKLQPGRSRFDDYADALDDSLDARTNDSLTDTEIAGLALFIGKADCVSCHNGPLLSNHEFHNTGVLAVDGQLPPMGRYEGVRMARQDSFNCLGPYSDAKPEQCLELRFALDSNELVGAHKTPTLRNVSETAPYMHGGQIATMAEVIQHYNEAPVSMLSHNEAKPLGLRAAELRQLEAFMHSLTAPLATAPRWLQAPASAQGEQALE